MVNNQELWELLPVWDKFFWKISFVRFIYSSSSVSAVKAKWIFFKLVKASHKFYLIQNLYRDQLNLMKIIPIFSSNSSRCNGNFISNCFKNRSKLRFMNLENPTKKLTSHNRLNYTFRQLLLLILNVRNFFISSFLP